MRLIQTLALAMVMFVLVLGGCTSSTETTETTQVVEPQGVAETGAVSPNFKEERLKEAMRGLRYESGLVRVDETVAAGIPDVGNRAAAEKSYEEGLHLLLEVNDRVAAIGALTRAVVMWPEEARYYVGLGQALLHKGKNAEAQASLRTALGMEPESVDAQYHLARALGMSGERTASIEAWQRLLELEPGRGEAHGRLAIQLYYEGAYDSSWEHVHTAESLGYDVPAQFRPLLEGKMPEPVK